MGATALAYDGLRPARALLLETGAGDALRETPLAAHLPYVTAPGLGPFTA